MRHCTGSENSWEGGSAVVCAFLPQQQCERHLLCGCAHARAERRWLAQILVIFIIIIFYRHATAKSHQLSTTMSRCLFTFKMRKFWRWPCIYIAQQAFRIIAFIRAKLEPQPPTRENSAIKEIRGTQVMRAPCCRRGEESLPAWMSTAVGHRSCVSHQSNKHPSYLGTHVDSVELCLFV